MYTYKKHWQLYHNIRPAYHIDCKMQLDLRDANVWKCGFLQSMKHGTCKVVMSSRNEHLWDARDKNIFMIITIIVIIKTITWALCNLLGIGVWHYHGAVSSSAPLHLSANSLKYLPNIYHLPSGCVPGKNAKTRRTTAWTFFQGSCPTNCLTEVMPLGWLVEGWQG